MATSCVPNRFDGRNLILGIVDKYSFYQISRFLLTLRQTNYDGHVCLFAGPNISTATVARMERLGVEVICYRDSFPFISSPHRDNVTSLPGRIHIYNYRHFLYYDYLLKHPREFRYILLSDVKDVVFQRDPFDCEIEDRLYVAMESPAIPIGKCECTPAWLLAGYGAHVLERLKDERMSCAGTTLGPAARVETYLRSMLAQIQTMNDAYACADQAAHNVMLHDRLLEPVERMENFRGPVLTVGTEPRYKLNDQRQLVNDDGTVINVVHQYDRHQELTDLFEAKVRPAFLRRTFSKLGFLLHDEAQRRKRRLRVKVHDLQRRLGIRKGSAAHEA